MSWARYCSTSLRSIVDSDYICPAVTVGTSAEVGRELLSPILEWRMSMRSARSCTLVILPSMSSTLRCLAMLNSFLIFGYFKKGSASGYFAWTTCSFTFSMAFWNS